jgi:hypothetical protein
METIPLAKSDDSNVVSRGEWAAMDGGIVVGCPVCGEAQPFECTVLDSGMIEIMFVCLADVACRCACYVRAIPNNGDTDV